jgi:hypothetical protein
VLYEGGGIGGLHGSSDHSNGSSKMPQASRDPGTIGSSGTLRRPIEQLFTGGRKPILVEEGNFDDQVSKLDAAHSKMTQLPKYNALNGPNSNTYTRQLLVNGGYPSPPTPPNGIAPGWNHPGYGGGYTLYDPNGRPYYYDRNGVRQEGGSPTGEDPMNALHSRGGVVSEGNH